MPRSSKARPMTERFTKQGVKVRTPVPERHPCAHARAPSHTAALQCHEKDTNGARWLSCSSCDDGTPTLKVKMTRLALPAKNVGTGTAKAPEQPFSSKKRGFFFVLVCF